MLRPILYLTSFLTLVTAEETGRAAWLRYAAFPGAQNHVGSLPTAIVSLNATTTSPVNVAGVELQKGISGIFSQNLTVQHTASSHNASSVVVVGTQAQYNQAYGNSLGLGIAIPTLSADGFYLSVNGPTVHIIGENERGALYGAFEYLSMLAQGNFSTVAYATDPVAPLRWVNQWDNLDGSITRGFGGLSIFFSNGTVLPDLTRAAEYARILASIRINAVVVHNVNADANLLLPYNLAGLGRIANAMRPYGIQIGISLNFASPMQIGNLSTFDPLDAGVINFWTNITNQLYQQVPDMAGYLVKANSEGQPGPLTYNRTLAQGANLFAKAIQPHGGIVMFRAFVYDLLNETDWQADRANAANDYFQPLDGQFMDNVVVQAKYGPIDFQVREPVNPIFANMRETNMAIELQVCQEYLGQQSHLVYLPPLWQTIFGFDLRIDQKQSLTRDVFNGKTFNRSLAGSAAVVNVGLNDTWLGSHTAMSNLYAYGRLAWDPVQDSEAILEDWTRLTFSMDASVINTINQISMTSWPAYENYSGNLGLQTLTDILYTHYGPNPASQEFNGYGQWTRVGPNMLGMDRTVSNGTGNGTGYAGRYPQEVYQMYENLDTTPDNLLLWFHHVPYTYQLHSGETVIQHMYNAHYAGAETANTYPGLWQTLAGAVDELRFNDVLYHLTYQAGHSIVWRDFVNEYFYNFTSIPDDHGRVHHHPYRVEAESMQLSNYKIYPVLPLFEAASNKTAIVIDNYYAAGTASYKVTYPSGFYDIAVGYFDLYAGNSEWDLYLNEHKLGQWAGNEEFHLGHELTYFLDGNSATRITFQNVSIQTGDMLTIMGYASGIESAPLDYVTFLPVGSGILD